MPKGIYACIVFVAGACYGILSTFVKIAYAAGLDLTDVSGVQCLFGMFFLWAGVFFTRKKTLTPFHVLSLLAIGIPMALTTIFYYRSLETLSASLAVVFLFQSIWMGSVVETFISRRFPSPLKCLSIILCLAGTFLAAGFLEGNQPLSLSSGMVWGLLAALSYTAVITASSLLGEGIPPALKGALMATGDTILTFIVLPPVFILTPAIWPALLPFGLLLGLFGVALPPFLLSWGMPQDRRNGGRATPKSPRRSPKGRRAGQMAGVRINTGGRTINVSIVSPVAMRAPFRAGGIPSPRRELAVMTAV